VEQDYLGVDKIYYSPTDRGHEARIAAYLAQIRGRAAGKNQAPGTLESDGGEGGRCGDSST
jgi:hypothetical protein